MLLLVFAVISMTHAIQVHELAEEKTPYDYVNEKLDAIGMDARSGLPMSNSYEVEESEDYPDEVKGAASTVLNTVAGGLGQGIGLGGFGNIGGIGLGQGLGLGYGGVGVGGLGGVGGVGGLGGVGVSGLGVGGLGAGGVGIGGIGIGPGGIGYGGGLVNQGIGGLGVGGIGLGNGLLYHPILGAQVGGGYVDKNAYDAAQKKGADENIEKIEKKAEEETKHGQEGFQQAAAAAKAEKGESSFYKDEEAQKKAAGDEKFYEGGQKFDKHGELKIFTQNMYEELKF